MGPERHLRRRFAAALRGLETVTRPQDPDTAAALARRWAELPAPVRGDAQLLGRRTLGCEGTHGVFPRCNLACTPCYHGAEANRVRIDTEHTLELVDRQMRHLRRVRGADQHAQLIGGEVTLLGPEAHADALELMERHRRKPMSMSHGDFDETYLRALALDPEGRPRFSKLRFAGHFDSLMRGRRGLPRPRSEQELDPFRAAFVGRFEALERDHGVRFDLAHNMTVTPRNLEQVGDVVRSCLRLRFGMLSFQPAAYVGDPRRWEPGYREVSIDAVWDRIEAAVGTRLPWRHLQVGDRRCNRAAYGILAGGRWIALLDDRDPRDLATRDVFLDAFGGMDFERPRWQVAIAILRVLRRRPGAVPVALGWARRFGRRAGWRPLLLGHPRGLTFVVHAFMDATVVRPAWEASERGETAADPEVRAAQERLAACSYAMAHPEDDRLVPACVQHAVLDPVEVAALRRRSLSERVA